MPTVVLLRGLNTYNTDEVRIGPLRLGCFYTHWENHLKRRGLTSLKVPELGPGTLKSSYSGALKFLQEQIKDGALSRFHLLTHSSGGLIGRKLTTEPSLKEHILSLATVACPHSGSDLVNLAEKWSRKASARRLLYLLGYDLDDRLDHIRELSIEKMTEFNRFHPAMKSVRQINIPCSLAPAKRSWLFSLFGKFVEGQRPVDGDGLLPLKSQIWADVETFGPLQLDHLSSLGFFTHLSPQNRNLAARELERLFDHLMPIWTGQR